MAPGVLIRPGPGAPGSPRASVRDEPGWLRARS